MNRHNRQTNLQRQRGASLLEIIAYLGIAAIVVLGAVSMLGSAFSNAQANRTVEEVVSIRTGIKRLYMGQSASYGTTVITEQAVSARVLPATLAVGADKKSATNAWNGTVAVTGATQNFTISYAGVPKDACVTILSGASGWVSVGTGTGSGSQITAFPVTPAAAQTACSADTNTITWTAT